MEKWLTVERATLLVIALCLGVEISAALLLEAFNWYLDTEVLPLLRLSGLAAVGLAAYWAFDTIFERFTVPARTAWWDPGDEPDGKTLTWDEVYGLVAFGDAVDPIAVAARVRWRWWYRSLRVQIPLYLAIWGLVLSAIDLLRDPWPRNFMLDANTPRVAGILTSTLSNPTAYLAMLLGIATIFFTFRQIRAKVRADSRQQWIIRARSLLGEVVALIDAHRDLREANKFKQAEEIWTRLNPMRLELELMLNPSEKDHRLLLYLIQRFATWRDPPQHSQDARIVIRSILADAGGSAQGEMPSSESKWKPIIDGDDRHELVSYILRLSHVVLKREWERVKHTR